MILLGLQITAVAMRHLPFLRSTNRLKMATTEAKIRTAKAQIPTTKSRNSDSAG